METSSSSGEVVYPSIDRALASLRRRHGPKGKTILVGGHSSAFSTVGRVPLQALSSLNGNPRMHTEAANEPSILHLEAADDTRRESERDSRWGKWFPAVSASTHPLEGLSSGVLASPSTSRLLKFADFGTYSPEKGEASPSTSTTAAAPSLALPEREAGPFPPDKALSTAPQKGEWVCKIESVEKSGNTKDGVRRKREDGTQQGAEHSLQCPGGISLSNYNALDIYPRSFPLSQVRQNPPMGEVSRAITSGHPTGSSVAAATEFPWSPLRKAAKAAVEDGGGLSISLETEKRRLDPWLTCECPRCSHRPRKEGEQSSSKKEMSFAKRIARLVAIEEAKSREKRNQEIHVLISTPLKESSR